MDPPSLKRHPPEAIAGKHRFRLRVGSCEASSVVLSRGFPATAFAPIVGFTVAAQASRATKGMITTP